MSLTTHHEENENGHILISRRDDKPPVVGSTNNDLYASTAIAFANTITSDAEIYQTDALDDVTRSKAGPMIAATKVRLDEGLTEKRDFEAAKAIVMEIPKSVRTDHFAEIRELYRSLSTPAAVKRASAADLEELSALIDGEQGLTGLNDDAWKVVEDRFILLGHIERTGLSAQFQKKPSIDKILISGVDHQAAEAAAREALKQFKAREDTLADMEVEILSMIRWLSNVTSRSAADTLDLVLAA